MKLRLRGDSLRLRLTRSEIAALRDQGWWQETAHLGALGGPSLSYRVEMTETGGPAVRLAAGSETVVTVILRRADVQPWADNAEVGLYFEEPWGLKVAVEKDFRCLDPRRDEDESDNFANPNEGSAHLDCGTED